MRNEKIAVFPVDEDFLFIPNNENIELGKKRYKISYYITLAGWNVGNTEKQLYALDEFNFKNIDTLVLINSLRKLEDDVIQKIISEATKNSIRIVCARDDVDVNYEMLKRVCIDESVAFEMVCDETSLVNSKVINNIDIPVITISGVGPYVGKFQVGLYLRFVSSTRWLIFLMPHVYCIFCYPEIYHPNPCCFLALVSPSFPLVSEVIAAVGPCQW